VLEEGNKDDVRLRAHRPLPIIAAIALPLLSSSNDGKNRC